MILVTTYVMFSHNVVHTKRVSQVSPLFKVDSNTDKTQTDLHCTEWSIYIYLGE